MIPLEICSTCITSALFVISFAALDIKNGNCPSMFSRKSLSLGCPILDEIFRGGILSQGITEVTGESASGKTQLCLQLCLMAQLPLEEGGLNGGKVKITIVSWGEIVKI